jgi:hypothetical protein
MKGGITPAAQWSPIVEEYKSLLGRPLLPAEANRLESLAVTLNRELVWQHIDLNENTWKPGRKRGKHDR